MHLAGEGPLGASTALDVKQPCSMPCLAHQSRPLLSTRSARPQGLTGVLHVHGVQPHNQVQAWRGGRAAAGEWCKSILCQSAPAGGAWRTGGGDTPQVSQYFLPPHCMPTSQACMARTSRPAVCQSLRSGRCSLRRHLYPATFTCCYCPYVCLHLRPFPPCCRHPRGHWAQLVSGRQPAADAAAVRLAVHGCVPLSQRPYCLADHHGGSCSCTAMPCHG